MVSADRGGYAEPARLEQWKLLARDFTPNELCEPPGGDRHHRRRGEAVIAVKKGKKGKGSGERFVALHHWLLKSPAWRALSPNAKAVLLHLWERHNGSNNGQIVYAVRDAANIEINKSSAARALTELIDNGFLRVTRWSAFRLKTKESREWELTAEPVDGAPQCLAAFVPLWAGAASSAQAAATRALLPLFEHDHGLVTCEEGWPDGTEHNYPVGWAYSHWFAVDGLRRYGYGEDATRIARKWVRLVADRYRDTGEFWERYDVVDSERDVAGRYTTQSGFGWTNGVHAALVARVPGIV